MCWYPLSSEKQDTNKNTNKSPGWPRLWPNRRDQIQCYRFVFADVSDDREHLRTLSGAQGRNRTTDTAIFNRMLYQLSYLGAKS